MPLTPEAIRHLEAVGDRAWPPAEAEPHDGWVLRATGTGIGRRVNSVAPLARGTLPLEQNVATAATFYRHRGLPPTFKLTDAALPENLDEYLAERGFRVDAPVLIMTRALGPGGAPIPHLPAEPAPEWLAVNAAVPSHYGAAPEAFLELLGRIRPPAAFATHHTGGEAAAIGMAVADGEWVGLFEIGTVPEHRRRGRATAVVEDLMAWGAGRGARTAYLQVMEENAPARALYEDLGFAEAYRYWYRVSG
jgi:ribosomal protein S18 acetylase RimI-like enzyme